ncbi:putative ABC transport system ATP-binding protein [Cyclobacterium lianum]|uniref:Putative ABC transport system ATP-binding protein n=1 Tax=Cyclobacterium lianum TaxID=388280 RepID=A0A1M7PDR4_9BACT|nr:ABC transporter ATP-binding protein [Cyclobacterium lianum]SHN15070.1 putative ABC transport system ATP-binding protein [Cyclobacterium lianum]
MIATKSIQFAYEGVPAFELPDLEIGAGESLLVLGKSGSGKTTFLNIMAGLLAPKAGEVLVNGTSLYALRGHRLDKFRGKNIGIVFQKPHILSPLTVGENVALPQFFSKKSVSRDVDRMLDELGIMDKKNKRIDTLSEGEAQRVSIARALVNDPKVILADEPTASLDDDNAGIVVHLLKSQAMRLGAALLIVTHDHRIKSEIDQSITLKRKDL